MNIGIILNETGRSFKNNLWINILLMAQFVICFLLLLVILTFHVQIGNNDISCSVENIVDEKWYQVMLDYEYDYFERAASPSGLADIKGFYNEIENSTMFDRFSFSNQNAILFSKDMMDERFGKNQYDFLLDNDDGRMPASSCYVESKDGDEKRRDAKLQCVTMNARTFELFHLSVSEGEPFTQNRVTITSDNCRVPIWLGAAYKGYFKPGDQLRIQYGTMGGDDKFYECEIAGILESNSVIPIEEPHDDVTPLDDCVIFPLGLTIAYVPQDLDKRARYAGQYTEDLRGSYIALNDGTSYNDVIIWFNAMSKKYDVYPMMFYSTSFGTDVLQNESQSTISILTILTVVLMGFTLFCLLTSAISKIRSNLRSYAIYISNGSSLGNIIVPYLLEMLIILIPAVSLNWLLIQRKTFFTGNSMPVLLIFGMAFCVTALMGLYVAIKLKGLNTEELMRRKE